VGRAHGGSQPAPTDGYYVLALVITAAIVAVARARPVRILSTASFRRGWQRGWQEPSAA